jgi:DNA-binding transcriptional MerR regulator
VFRIAAFARLGGVSPKVLRDYDRLAIFRPAWTDRYTGYRLYTPAQLPDLRRILALRDLGVGLAEIRAYVVDGADLRAVLERRRKALEAARREVDRRLAAVGISLGAAGQAGPGAEVVVRNVPAELVATLDIAQAGADEGQAFYQLELAVRDAGIRAPRPPGTLIGDQRAVVFVPVRRAAAGLTVRRLPAIRAATILHRGSYGSLEETRALLDAWLAGSGLQRQSPERVLYLQFGAEADLRLPAAYVVSSAAELLTELQVPVD